MQGFKLRQIYMGRNSEFSSLNLHFPTLGYLQLDCSISPFLPEIFCLWNFDPLVLFCVFCLIKIDNFLLDVVGNNVFPKSSPTGKRLQLFSFFLYLLSFQLERMATGCNPICFSATHFFTRYPQVQPWHGTSNLPCGTYPKLKTKQKVGSLFTWFVAWRVKPTVRVAFILTSSILTHNPSASGLYVLLNFKIPSWINKYPWGAPPPSNIDHQIAFILSRESFQTFTC